MISTIQEIQRFLYQKARARTGPLDEPLMRYVTEWSVLRAAWRQVAGASGSRTAGADGTTAAEIRAAPETLEAFLQDLAARLQSGSYQLGAVRRFQIRKIGDPDKMRPLAILNLADRVVHTAVKMVLDPIVEARLSKRCFGFRSGRGRYDQLQAVRRLVQSQPERYQAAICTDVASCFDQLDHALLRKDLRSLVVDRAFSRLLDQILTHVGDGRKEWWARRSVGVLQGSPLSPLLANLNLARFDRAWQEVHGDHAPAFRYADDLAVLVHDECVAVRLRSALRRCLRRNNRLRLVNEKTQIVTFDQGVPLLGLVLRRNQDPFDQCPHIRTLLDPRKVHEVLAEIGRWAEQIDADRPLGRQFRALNQRLRGWFESFQYAYDASQAFEAIDRHLFAGTRRKLKQLLGYSASQLQTHHFVRLPSGHDSWQADGEVLLVLSAVPRKQYRPKAQRLPWEPRATAGSIVTPAPLSAADCQPDDLPPDLQPARQPQHASRSGGSFDGSQ
jgi:RNA-directed DNA polymerase